MACFNASCISGRMLSSSCPYASLIDWAVNDTPLMSNSICWEANASCISCLRLATHCPSFPSLSAWSSTLARLHSVDCCRAAFCSAAADWISACKFWNVSGSSSFPLYSIAIRSILALNCALDTCWVMSASFFCNSWIVLASSISMIPSSMAALYASPSCLPSSWTSPLMDAYILSNPAISSFPAALSFPNRACTLICVVYCDCSTIWRALWIDSFTADA